MAATKKTPGTTRRKSITVKAKRATNTNSRSPKKATKKTGKSVTKQPVLKKTAKKATKSRSTKAGIKKLSVKKTAVKTVAKVKKQATAKKRDTNWTAAQVLAKRDLKKTANNTNVTLSDQAAKPHAKIPTYGGKPIPTTKHALAKMFLPLVNDVASHIARRLPAHVLYEDLLSAGHFGLASAIDRFDPDRRETFKGYAEFRIRGAIKDELRRQDMMSRDARIESKAVKRRVDALELKLGRKPSDEEVAALLDVSLKEYRAMQLKLISVQVVSSECFYVSDNRDLPEDIASKNELKQRIESALSHLPCRQADIVRKIYLEDQPLKDIAANMNVSSSRVCQIRNDAAKKLQGLLADFRPTGS